MERFLLLFLVVSSRLPPREEEEHRSSDADDDDDATAAAARMWSCDRAKRREKREREMPLFLFSVTRVCRALVELFLFVVSKNEKKKGEKSVGKKYTNTKDQRQRKLTTQRKKKRADALFDRKPAHSSTLPYGRELRFDRTGVRTRDLFNNNTFLDVWDRKKTVKVLPLAFYQV